MAADLSSPRQVWAKGAGEAREADFATHVKAIAHGRYVMRHILHLLDEQAVAAGMQPLTHQTLLQVFGADEPLSVSELADRLAVAPALMSRMVRRLEEDGLVEHVHQFHRKLSDESKLGALATFASYLGLDADPRLSELLADADIELDAHGHVHADAAARHYPAGER